MFRFPPLFLSAVVLAGCTMSAAAQPAAGHSIMAAADAGQTITVDTAAEGQAFPHFWEDMFGSGRAHLVMRAQYQKDLTKVKKVTNFKYVRFHGILDDENGVYSVGKDGQPEYNWTYVDHIYDALLAHGIKPFVEISFMPKALASKPTQQAFWYKPYISPPSSYAKWDGLIEAFARHLIQRYGIDEVSTWYFEVWNEPNIGFWAGTPAQESYFQLYDHTARALKAVSPRLRVGGPATAQAAWVSDLIAHATKDHVPLDFVSTHVYGDDTAENVFHDQEKIAPHQMVCAAVSRVHEEIEKSARPHIPLIWSEFNASYANHQDITDSIYMGPWLANTIRECDGKVQMMSYWSFSDVFEEQGVKKTPFYGGFGLLAENGIPKPAYDAFALLHKLGYRLLPTKAEDALVTRRADGTLVIAAWNEVEPGMTGPSRTIHFDLKGLGENAEARIRRVDAQHGDTLAAWKAMGSPKYPTLQQIHELKKAAKMGPPQVVEVHDGQLSVTVPAMGLAVMTVRETH
jgi:xylan 1,4-beta-xylosidase